MLETLLITFREGLEAFLIVAITLAYLTKTGRGHLANAVYAGIIVALGISATAGYHIGGLAEDPLMEGALALGAGVLVASMTVYVMKTAATIKQSITSQLENQAQKTGMAALAGVFLFTVLMISREGMETALMLGTISAQVNASAMWLGAILGIALTAAIGWFWVKHSHRINLKVFMQVTGAFLVLFSIQLFIYGLHELTETGLLPIDNFYWHNLTEPLEPGEPIGNIITYSLLVVPCAWLFIAYVRDKLITHAQPAE